MAWYSAVFTPANLKRTATVALIVGTAFFCMNQLGVILDGHATALVWVKAALTYVTPLVVANVGVVSATRRHAPRTKPANERIHPRSTDFSEQGLRT